MQGSIERVFVMKKSEMVKPKDEKRYGLEKNGQSKEEISQKNQVHYNKSKDHLNAKRRLSYAKNRESRLVKNRAYRIKNKERINQRRREYYKKNREHLCAYHRAYYKKNQERIRAKQREYYAENRYERCRHSLNSYCVESIRSIGDTCKERVNEYTQRYPFEIYADPYIERMLRKKRISPNNPRYDECYSAGMFAYLYSIHRCALMKYSHVESYIKKMIKVYFVCAIVIYNETNNLCKTHGFRHVQLDAEYAFNRY